MTSRRRVTSTGSSRSSGTPARELVDADGATFVLRDERQCFYVDEDAIQPLWRGQRFPLDACISGWSMLHSEQVVVTDSVLVDLADLIGSRGAIIVVADLPHVRGSAPLLERVVQNLVVNAISYGDPAAPRVRIEGGVRGTEVTSGSVTTAAGSPRTSARRSSTCSRARQTPTHSRRGPASDWPSPDAWWRATAGRSPSPTPRAAERASRGAARPGDLTGVRPRPETSMGSLSGWCR